MNHKLGNGSLTCDGHQFHQYQQNEQLPLICTEHKNKRRHITFGIQTLAWDMHTNVAGVKPIN